MTTSTLEETQTKTNATSWTPDHRLHTLITETKSHYIEVVKSDALIHALFLLALSTELFAFLLFFPFFMRSALLALGASLFFLTLFAFFIMRLYLQGRKREQLKELLQGFLKETRQTILPKKNLFEWHMLVAQACIKLSNALEDTEYRLFTFLRTHPPLFVFVEKVSSYLHWKDLFLTREILLLQSVKEHLHLVRREPINLEIHTALASAYVTLSSLYHQMTEKDGLEDEPWKTHQAFTKQINKKFRLSAQRAIEELNIINDYAPHDPWIHTQLAYSYRDLGMPQEEIREYETVLELCPGDRETLFKLGTLYFQQGLNAKGLQIYEQLKLTHYNQAKQLLAYYGKSSEIEEEL